MITRAFQSKILLLGVALVSIVSLSADDRFAATIQANPETATTSIRIRIPKEAHSQPIQSAYLQRKSTKGLDIHVPIMVSEDAKAYSIFMILPTSIADKATISVTHKLAVTPNPDGSVGIGSGVQGGESYTIALTQTGNKKSESAPRE